MSDFTIDVTVKPIIKEYVHFITNNTGILEIGKKDHLASVIINNLQTVPFNYKPTKPAGSFIKIYIPWQHVDKKVNVMFRNFIEPSAEKEIEMHIFGLFKEVFHNYMLGQVMAGIKQVHAIENFCEVYKLNMDLTVFEMLKKSWNRSREKKLYKDIEN